MAHSPARRGAIQLRGGVGFLILLLYHILTGFWLMVEDYVHCSGLRVTLFGVAWILGISFLILGFVTLVPFGT